MSMKQKPIFDLTNKKTGHEIVEQDILKSVAYPG